MALFFWAIVIAVIFIGLVYPIWMLIQNQFTYKDMVRMMAKIREVYDDNDTWWALMNEQREVDYDAHLNTRARLGDWKTLYPKLIARFPEFK